MGIPLKTWPLLLTALALTCALPAGADNPNAEAAPARTQRSLEETLRLWKMAREHRDFTREELLRLLDTAPASHFMCGTGERRVYLELIPGHPLKTVALLKSLWSSEQEKWRRFHLLEALSQERADLQTFWLERWRRATEERTQFDTVVRGLGNAGSDEDVMSLIHDPRAPETGLLERALADRRLKAAVPYLISRFRREGVRSYHRTSALEALLLIIPSDGVALVSEALRDPDREMREDAACTVWLCPQVLLDEGIRGLLKTATPRTWGFALGSSAIYVMQPAPAQAREVITKLLNDRDPEVKAAAKNALTLVAQRPPIRAGGQ